MKLINDLLIFPQKFRYDPDVYRFHSDVNKRSCKVPIQLYKTTYNNNPKLGPYLIPLYVMVYYYKKTYYILRPTVEKEIKMLIQNNIERENLIEC